MRNPVHRTLQSISDQLGLSRTTFYRRRLEHNLPVGKEWFSDLPDEAVDAVVRDILAVNPNAGETMIRGGFASRGIKIQVVRIRQSIFRYV